MLREVALWIGYVVLALGSAAGTVAVVGGLLWWLAQKAVEQWTSMDLFWHTCIRISKERTAEKQRKGAVLDFEAIKARKEEQ